MQVQSNTKHSLSSSSEKRGSDQGTIASILAAVEAAKHAANDSLSRAQSVPLPHIADNIMFITLFERHLSDREVLFSRLRQLDDAKATLTA